MRPVAAVVGGGVIGGGWLARFLLNGWDVQVFDPDPEAERKLTEVLANARRSLPGLYDTALPLEGTWRLCATVEEAVAGARWVQESVPERLELKHRVLTQMQQVLPVMRSLSSAQKTQTTQSNRIALWASEAALLRPHQLTQA